MKKELKEMLRDAMEAPAPVRKQEFLRSVLQSKMLSRPSISYGRFVTEQIFFIGKWGWGGSAGIFLLALLACNCMDRNVLWALSAMTPFLAVLLVAEGLRSEICGMAELEIATRFSLKSLILARMAVMGAVHLLLLIMNTFLGYWQGGISLLHVGIYLLTPYLLVNATGLFLARRIRGKECIYGILAVASVVAVLPFGARNLYQEKLLTWWLVALAVFGILAVKEWKRNVERWEEYTWNLS